MGKRTADDKYWEDKDDRKTERIVQLALITGAVFVLGIVVLFLLI